jgi:transcriptional regulator with XRE-family HTH domain
LVIMTSQATGGEQDLPAEQPHPAAPEPALNPLQRLIQERLRERGWSYGAVARRGGLPRSTLYTLATTRNLARPPRPATIDALAKGLDVPVSAVRTAAAESTGLHYYDESPARRQDPGDREKELLIASIDELTPEDLRHVAALVESMRNKVRQEPEGGPLAPPPGPGPRDVRAVPGGRALIPEARGTVARAAS